MKNEQKLAAVIFDFDGVIVNTEPLHFVAFREILQTKGLAFSWEEYVSFYLGFDDRAAFREAFKRGGRALPGADLSKLILAKAEAFQRLAEEKGAQPFPGVLPLIKSLTRKVPLALCSGAVKSDIDPILRKLKLNRAFDVIVTAEDVSASKPDPASYVLALKRLAKAFPAKKISADHCVAIEDTPAGIKAASGAGLRVLALSNSYAPEKLDAAEKVVPSLKNIKKIDLVRLVGRGERDCGK
jgi:HAD superfamily hydrolase (TIGR01509 family)